MQEDIFNLIKTLNTAEKRLVNSALKKKYVSLLNYLHKRHRFERDKIHAYIKSREDLGTPSASFRALYNKTLQILHGHGDKGQVRQVIQKHYHYAEWLGQRDQHALADRELDLGIALARDHQMAQLCYDGLLERIRVTKYLETAKIGQQMKALGEELAVMAHQIKAYHYLNELHFKTAEYVPLSPKERKDVEQKIASFPYTLNDLDFEGKVRFCFFKYLALRKKGKMTEAHQWAIRALALFEEYPKFINHYAGSYAHTLDLHINSLKNIEEWDLLKDAADQLMKTSKETSTNWPTWIRYKFIQASLLGQLNYWLGSHQYKEVTREELDQIVDIVSTKSSSFHHHRYHALHYLLGLIFFLRGKEEEALHWLNQIPQRKPDEVRSIMKRASTIISLYAHYSLQNSDELYTKVGSTIRNFRRLEAAPYEIQLLTCLQKMLNAPPNKKDRELVIRKCFETLKATYLAHPTNNWVALTEVILWFKRHFDALDVRFLDETPVS